MKMRFATGIAVAALLVTVFYTTRYIGWLNRSTVDYESLVQRVEQLEFKVRLLEQEPQKGAAAFHYAPLRDRTAPAPNVANQQHKEPQLTPGERELLGALLRESNWVEESQ